MMNNLDLVNDYLRKCIDVLNDDNNLSKSMNYSLLAGGKRIRPLLVLEFASLFNCDIKQCLPIACSIELIHTYSLIHDDLPCMDNDELRRGKPTNHIVFGESIATLAGDALQPLAFELICNSNFDNDIKINCINILSKAAGYKGMCAGQYLDIIGEDKELSESQLTEINNLKTGALISAACMMGVSIGKGTINQLNAADIIGKKLGLAFQIKDDVLDVISTESELGKNICSDLNKNKNTYMSLLGMNKCNHIIHCLTQDAILLLKNNFSNTDNLVNIAISLENRSF